MLGYLPYDANTQTSIVAIHASQTFPSRSEEKLTREATSRRDSHLGFTGLHPQPKSPARIRGRGVWCGLEL
ncbi:hypothetical protein E2542_SST27806 [Spatholobus suberectus]|nr:hypothetical protein E2542_SST27806 [Spatholobus suberectus]